MSVVNTHALLSPLATKLATLAAQNPELAKMVVTVMTKGVDRALRTGPTNIEVWARSFEGAARQFANREFAKKWTKAVAARFPGKRPPETIAEKNARAR